MSVNKQRNYRMDYFIEQGAWEQILLFLLKTKGIHTGDERELRRFIEGVWYIPQGGNGVFYRVIMVIGAAFITVLNAGLIGAFGPIF